MAKDCRAINEALLKDLKEGGFKEFVEFVKKNEDKLALCFRGNTGSGYVAIYYKNHYVWKLSRSIGNQLKVSISFNHARYTENWEEKLEELYKKYNFNSTCTKEKLQKNYKIADSGFKGDKLNLEGLKKAFRNGLKSEDGYLTTISDYFSKDFVEGTYEILESIIEDHFDIKKTKDQFKGNSDISHSNKLEKIRQHELFLKNNNTKNGLFIYDLEFAQLEAKKYGISCGQPDMFAIRFENGIPQALELIEVKSQKNAITDNGSGLEDHIKYMKEYVKNAELVKNRREEAIKIIEQYRSLGLRHIDKNVKLDNIQNIPIEIGVILTDDAVEWFNKNKEIISKKYKVINENSNEVFIIEKN